MSSSYWLRRVSPTSRSSSSSTGTRRSSRRSSTRVRNPMPTLSASSPLITTCSCVRSSWGWVPISIRSFGENCGKTSQIWASSTSLALRFLRLSIRLNTTTIRCRRSIPIFLSPLRYLCSSSSMSSMTATREWSYSGRRRKLQNPIVKRRSRRRV